MDTGAQRLQRADARHAKIDLGVRAPGDEVQNLDRAVGKIGFDRAFARIAYRAVGKCERALEPAGSAQMQPPSAQDKLAAIESGEIRKRARYRDRRTAQTPNRAGPIAGRTARPVGGGDVGRDTAAVLPGERNERPCGDRHSAHACHGATRGSVRAKARSIFCIQRSFFWERASEPIRPPPD